MSDPIIDDSINSQIDTVSTKSPISIEKFREGLPVSLYSRIVEICIYYEKTWTRDRIFSIEEGLKLVSDDDQKELFERLYEVDLLYGYSHHAALPLSNYQKRFPEYGEVVREIYDRVSKESVAINTDRIGKKIEHYRIEGIIGKGGMGVVYKAFDEPFDRYVAIKYLLPRFADFKESNDRFLHEIKLMGQLPSDIPFAHAYYYGVDDKVSYLVMEYVEGIDLGAYVNKKNSFRKTSGPLSWQEALGYVKQVAEGLKCIHRINIIHHDIKPENIIVNKDGKVKILDLGLGTFLKPVPNILTVNNNAKDEKKNLEGTPAYLPPEIYKDPDSAGCQSDIYCLGGTFFYLITGLLPIHWYNPQAESSLIPQKSLKDFLTENHIKRIPDSVYEILSKMLQPDCNRRYKNADEICFDIDSAIKNEQKSYWQSRKYSIMLHVFLLSIVILTCWIFGGNYYYYAKSIVEIQGDNFAAMPIIQKVRDKLLPPQKRSDFLLKRAMFYSKHARGNIDTIKKSKEDFSNYLKIIPTDFEALIYRAKLNLILNCPTEARQDLLQVSKLQTEDVSLLIESAKMSEVLKDFKEAQKFLDKAMLLKPKGVDIKLLKAQIYVKSYESNPIMTDYLDKAIDCLVHALEIDDKNKSLYYELAKTYVIYPEISPGEINVFKSQILANLEKAIQLDPAYIEATSLRADYYYNHEKNYKEAAEDFIVLRSLLNQPGLNHVYLNLANCYNSLGQLEQCHFVTALAINEQIDYENHRNPQYQYSDEAGMMIEKYNRHIDFILKTTKRDFRLGNKRWKVDDKQRLIIELKDLSSKVEQRYLSTASATLENTVPEKSDSSNSVVNKPEKPTSEGGSSSFRSFGQESKKDPVSSSNSVSNNTQTRSTSNKITEGSPTGKPNVVKPGTEFSAMGGINNNNRNVGGIGRDPNINSQNGRVENRSEHQVQGTSANKRDIKPGTDISSAENTVGSSAVKLNSGTVSSKPSKENSANGGKTPLVKPDDNQNKITNSTSQHFTDKIIFDSSKRAEAQRLFEKNKKESPSK